MDMKIERVISVFDNRTNKMVEEIIIDNLTVEELKGIFNQKKDDPKFYYPYDIGIKESRALGRLLKVSFNHNKFIYQLDCFQSG